MLGRDGRVRSETAGEVDLMLSRESIEKMGLLQLDPLSLLSHSDLDRQQSLDPLCCLSPELTALFFFTFLSRACF